MNWDVARGQDIGNGGRGFDSRPESWRQHVGVGRIVCVCVCYVSVLFVFVLCTQCYQSIHSHQKFQLAY